MDKKEFVKMWKVISNSKRIKPKFVDKEFSTGVFDKETKTYVKRIQRFKEKGYIYPEHHIIYNIIRGFPAERGFDKDSLGLINAKNSFKYNSIFTSDLFPEPFKGLMSDEEIKEVFTMVKEKLFSKN